MTRLGSVLMFSLILASASPASASATFRLVSGGPVDSSVAVSPGGSFEVRVIAEGIASEGTTQANLDSFTYRLAFPNQDFSLDGNVFAAPFDNTIAPAGFNGSIPWAGLPLPITHAADAGSPGATPSAADLYRTTASVAGTPATGDPVLVETLKLSAPTTPGVYPVALMVLEAADRVGEFHTARVGDDFTVTVPEPGMGVQLAAGLCALALLTGRRRA